MAQTVKTEARPWLESNSREYFWSKNFSVADEYIFFDLFVATVDLVLAVDSLPSVLFYSFDASFYSLFQSLLATS